MSKDIYRLGQFILCLISLLVLAASFYFQHVKGLPPCPLCIMQRFCVGLAIVSSLLGFYAGRHRFLFCLQMTVALAGLYFAARQLWLQSLPVDQLPACLPGFDVLLKYFPWHDILQALIWGAADCGEVNWQWLGLSMPAWSALYFAGLFFGVLACNLLRPAPSSDRPA